MISSMHACSLDIKLKSFEKGNTLVGYLPSVLFDVLAINSEWPFGCNESCLVSPANSPIKCYSCAEVSFIEKIVCFMHISPTYTGCPKKNICTIMAAFPPQGCLEYTSFTLIYRYISSRFIPYIQYINI